MSASLPARRAVVAIIALLLTAAGRQASATETAGPELQAELVWTAPARWYVELIGARCPSQRQDFEHEIALACGAVGGTCRSVSTPGEAEFRAILDCSGSAESWTLETRTVEGTLIDRIDLAGAPADRLREAAVEVARDAAPERALAVETLRTTLANEGPTGLEKRSEKFVLVLGGRATTTAARTVPSTGGARLLGGLAFGKTLRGTLGLAGEAGGSADKAIRTFRGGLGIGVGAPFDSGSVVGIAGEVGLTTTTKYGSSTANSDGGGLLTTRTDLVGYGQTTFTLQWPRAGLRPYAALSAAVMSEGAARVSASGEAGLAFAIF